MDIYIKRSKCLFDVDCLRKAESTYALAQSKVELLRVSLDQRLTEIPITSSFNKMSILREDLNHSHGTVQTRDSVVAKMAALSGKLSLRFEAVDCFSTM